MSVVYPQIQTSADLLKSTIRIEELIPFLQQQKAEACAIVNTRLYGLLPFWHQMKAAGIHPVAGLQLSVAFSDEAHLPIVLYAQTNEGYHSLLKIASAVAVRADNCLPIRWLKAYAKGCIGMIPALEKDAIWLQQVNVEHAAELQSIFNRHLYVGISRSEATVDSESFAIQFAERLGAVIVATHASSYLHAEDQFAYEVARAIDSGVKLHERGIVRHMEDRFVLSARAWQNRFHDVPQWLDNAKNMLLSCRVSLPKNVVHMSKFPVPTGMTAERLLEQRTVEGLQQIVQRALPTAYEDRLRYELSVINSMGYADYFLIVEDFMRFAREANILTGPGRGSSASSLVAYALQITQVDPLQYDLLFERFLNPERVSLPDIDIDFLDTRREEVIQYVKDKYGKQHVAQIITFGTLSAKAVARDVARMFNFAAEKLEYISKSIPNRIGITLQDAYTQSENLRQFIAAEPVHDEWFRAALKLEGLPRNASTHAAGIVLSPVPLVEIVPIEEGHDDVFLTQWPMQEVEQSGLLKMDFLGLRNLTILEQIRKSIYYTHQMDIDFKHIPLEDAATFQLLQRGDTAGIFQLESDGMRQALRDIRPTHFLDIVAVNALYRPGPMEFIPMYARRKHGAEIVTYSHPVLEPILRETYGIIIYQEQIMRIANVFAGFTIGQADLLRRAVSKKNRDVLEQQRAAFTAGAAGQGYPAQVANEVYELIVRFADYGFAKSHAVAYSVVSYQMAYLKANFPVNFYAALLTNAMGNSDKLTQIMNEAKGQGIQILPPSINKSARHFKVEHGAIRFSLSAIKNVPSPFLQKLLQVRGARQKPFTTIFDVAVSLSAKVFNKKVFEPLIKAGALDEFGRDRATLLATLDAAEKQAELVGLTEGDHALFGTPKHIDAPPLTEKEKLLYEKEVLGFYVSEHPIIRMRTHFNDLNATTQTLAAMRDGTFIKIIGLVEDIRQIRTKKGEQMAFVQVQDEFGVVSITLFPQVYEPLAKQLQHDQLVYVEGVLEQRFGKAQIKAKQLQIM
ncbi:MAG: DNA polymerase III subunit alpha [Solibacillus sp.]